MFDLSDRSKKVFNPLNVNANSIIEFSAGPLSNNGIYRFKKIVEFSINESKYSRYLLYSKVDDDEYVMEVHTGNNNCIETYIYYLSDTVPFSEEFLEVVGQKFLTTPDGFEFERTIMPYKEERIDGAQAKVKIYDIETDRTEKQLVVNLWDYQRDAEGITEYLNIEMSEETGLFKIFVGEGIEDIFYKIYQS
ncbi:hypothetical protein [Acetivibrio cellulolyticus]|uniref:hypothetical protein n=1 Tax=Acetivibrio cellulolyticus TaxID=35830 RepID=UPI0001E2F569|nr:hypothetical protein [Acetivibrio cellulolyticus]